ncbi:MAG: rRNA maturation RNase YbeY [Bacteroidales bacterium]|nr:rRNA maturation RNase YbeY [Bacteroidales bacterium]MCF8403484.1 rRNA maturation RNase YbeY [Bacteroidales bacterium]
MNRKNILFFVEEINFLLRNKNKIRTWIADSIAKENLDLRKINFIFSSDKYLYDLNVRYLSHKTLTDVITFEQSENTKEISGEIYISIPRVKENAKQFRTTFVNELHRVMIHGILHLMGYDDKTAEEAEMMRKKEDYYLSLLV